MRFRVYDLDGNDVTDEKEWFIDTKGNLYFMTDDVDSPLQECGGDFWYGE